MLEINKEYTYKEICEELEWSIQPSNNKTKQKQIKTIEESYEFYHPENKKTHKPKKSYVFTKQLKEPILVDMRKDNGKKNLFPDEEFDYLLDNILHTGENRNEYNRDGAKLNAVYVSNSLIYKEFGVDIYDMLASIKYSKFDTYNNVKREFKNICIDIVKSYTITRICKKYGYNKNSLPKGILRQRGERAKELTPDDDLLEKYNKIEKEILGKYGFKSIQEAIAKEKYFDILNDIQAEFEKDNIYGIRRYNVITFDYCKFKFVYDIKKKELYQEHFKRVVFDAIKKSIDNRISNPIDENGKRKYKHYYTPDECALLKNYCFQLLGIITNFKDEEYKEYMRNENTELLKITYLDDYVSYANNNDLELIELFG